MKNGTFILLLEFDSNLGFLGQKQPEKGLLKPKLDSVCQFLGLVVILGIKVRNASDYMWTGFRSNSLLVC